MNKQLYRKIALVLIAVILSKYFATNSCMSISICHIMLAKYLMNSSNAVEGVGRSMKYIHLESLVEIR